MFWFSFFLCMYKVYVLCICTMWMCVYVFVSVYVCEYGGRVARVYMWRSEDSLSCSFSFSTLLETEFFVIYFEYIKLAAFRDSPSTPPPPVKCGRIGDVCLPHPTIHGIQRSKLQSSCKLFIYGTISIANNRYHIL